PRRRPSPAAAQWAARPLPPGQTLPARPLARPQSRRHPGSGNSGSNQDRSSSTLRCCGSFCLFFQSYRGLHMKNNMKRDTKPNGKSAGEVVTLSTARLAAPGRPPGGAAIRAATRSGGSLPAPLGERRPAVRRSIKAAAKARTRRASRRMPIEKVVKESQRWLDLISRHDRVTPAQKKRVVKETVKSFDAYFNSGFLA